MMTISSGTAMTMVRQSEAAWAFISPVRPNSSLRMIIAGIRHSTCRDRPSTVAPRGRPVAWKTPLMIMTQTWKGSTTHWMRTM